MTYSCREKLTLALDVALQAHSAGVLSQLLDSHGSFIFALALAALPSRKMAEVLFMLATDEQADVHRRLSHDDRIRLAHVGSVKPSESSWACRHRSPPHPAISVCGRAEQRLLPGRFARSALAGEIT